MKGRRQYLGREYASGSQFRVYLLPDAVEVDELTYSQGERTRVYFDDVLLLTYHRRYGTAFLLFTAIVTAIFLLIALFNGAGTGTTRSDRELAVVMLVMASPFVLAFILRVIFRIDVITVYGRRTLARLNFHWRKGRAREVYSELRKRIEARQAQVAKEQAALAPPPPPPEPPGPPVFPEAPPLPPASPLDPTLPPAV